MTSQILVPLKKRDRINEILSSLHVLARPGTKVVFLVAFRQQVSWMETQMAAMQTGIATVSTINKLAADASKKAQLQWVDEAVRPVRDVLQKKDLSVDVHCYTGSFDRVVASLREPRTETIILLGGRRKIQNFITAAQKLLGRLKPKESTPILFVRTRQY